MVETKAQKEMKDTKVLTKANAAIKWCENASTHLLANGGKEWVYLLVPHDEVKENLKITDYLNRFRFQETV